MSIGATNGAFWTLAPLYAEFHGLSQIHIGLFMSAAVLGGALTQWPLGRWSDRTDRRRIIVGSCVTASLAAGGLVIEYASHEFIILTLAFLFGAGALPLYSLCIAHANDKAPPESFVQVSRDLLIVFGLGAIFGPLIGSWLMTIGGFMGVFLFTGCIHLTLAAYTLSHMWIHMPVPETEKAAFVSVPRTTQVVLGLDPRSESSGSPNPRPQEKGE